MKLKHFKRQEGYNFILEFENGEIIQKDIFGLIGNKVKPEELNSAKLDNEWGCLEFKDGMVDIEPKTLYRYTLHD